MDVFDLFKMPFLRPNLSIDDRPTTAEPNLLSIMHSNILGIIARDKGSFGAANASTLSASATD